jgi:hypothetical protein
MLDPNHPLTRWRFDVSHEEDAVLNLTKLMTLLPTHERRQLLSRIRRHIERLRRLNLEGFGGSDFIERAISDLEAGCNTIADFQSTESRLDGRGTCPVCHTAITDMPKYHHMTYCGQCLKIISDAMDRLGGFDGFGTDRI